MRNLFKMVFQRVVFVSFAILIQLLFLILTVFFFDTAWRWFSTAMSILSFLAVLYILSDRTNPSYKLAWVIPILAFPIFGGILYIMFGGNKLSKRQKVQLQTVDEITRSNLKQDPLVLHALQRKICSQPPRRSISSIVPALRSFRIQRAPITPPARAVFP